MVFELKERSFGDTLGTAFNLVLKNIGFIMKYIFLALLVFIVYFGVIGVLAYFGTDGFSSLDSLISDPDNISSMMGFMGIIMLVTLPIFLAVYIFVPVIFLQKFSSIYRGSDESMNLVESIKAAAPRFWPFLGAYFLMMLGIYGGMLLLIIPGIIFGLAWSMTPCILVLEKGKTVDSLSRSWNLTKGDRGSIFGAFFVMALIMYAVLFGAMILIGVLAAVAGSAGAAISAVLMIILEIAIMCIFYPAMLALSMVIYYNLIIKKEGFGDTKLEEEFHKPQVDPEA